MQMHAFLVTTTKTAITTWAQNSDQAVDQVIEAEGAPFNAFVSVYAVNPVPELSGKYGALLGRLSNHLDHDGLWKADHVPLDEGGYDAGGAYWGLRPPGTGLYAVQGGMGNIAFVDAAGPQGALRVAAA